MSEQKINHWLLALKTECFVLTRSRALWLLLLVPSLITILNLLYLRAQTIGQTITGEESTTVTVTGYGFMVDGFSSGLITLYLIFMLYSAMCFASDRDQGVIRHLVIRSISRSSIIWAKFLTLLSLALLSAAGVVALSCIVSANLWDLGPVIEDGYEIIGEEDIFPEIRTGLILALLPLPACLSIGLLISVCSRSAIRAVVTALGIVISFDLIKETFGGYGHFVSLSYQPSINDQSYLKDVAGIARGFSDILIDERIYQLNLWLPLPQAAIILILVIVLANRKTL